MPKFSERAKRATRNQLGLRIALKTLDVANLRARIIIYTKFNQKGMKGLRKFINGIKKNEKRGMRQLKDMQERWIRLKSKGQI